jgi:hypothetical protein
MPTTVRASHKGVDITVFIRLSRISRAPEDGSDPPVEVPILVEVLRTYKEDERENQTKEAWTGSDPAVAAPTR